jgi:hypothetical protein
MAFRRLTILQRLVKIIQETHAIISSLIIFHPLCVNVPFEFILVGLYALSGKG